MSASAKQSPRDAVLDYLRASPWTGDPNAGIKAVRHHYMCAAGVEIDDARPGSLKFTGQWAAEVITAARSGDSIAHDALCEIAEHLLKFDDPIPPALVRYLLDGARRTPTRKAGRRRGENVIRDNLIWRAVEIATRAGLPRTRNPATVSDSACSIVAQALGDAGGPHLSADAISKAWERVEKARTAAGYRRKQSG